MLSRTKSVISSAIALILIAAGATHADDEAEPVRLITLDPGHFHAALVQKTMYGDAVAPVVHVYAPPGPDVGDHLRRIDGFNSRAEAPTHWEERVYTGDDFLDRLLDERPGDVVVISGKNRRKAEYIRACAKAGLHVLSDKPMCIDAEGLATLRQAFEAAEENGTLIYDIMTERSEITTILQKELMHDAAVFGKLLIGSVEDPAVVKHSVHHFFKHVAGKPLKRPAWYFDTTQQGEGIVDVTTHLVDLVMWECFPDEVTDAKRDVRMLRAKRWPTMITREQYEKVTRLPDFPAYLQGKLDEQGVLPCYANGEMDYTIRGVHASVTVEWAYQAPEGGRDTHYSIMRGSRANIVIRQGAEQDYRPELYVEPATDADASDLEAALRKAIAGLQSEYASVGMVPAERGWRITIPGDLRIGHEAHFAQVMERFLDYRKNGALPVWETPNMLAKYATTTMALEKASEP